MEDEAVIQSDSLSNLLRSQWNILLVYIARPAVQRQLLIIGLIIILVWLIPLLIRRWYKRQGKRQELEQSRASGVLRLITFGALIAPIVGLMLSLAAILLFERSGYPNGLLANSLNIFWYWLVYRFLVIFLGGRFGKVARPYIRWVLTPVFVFIVISQILDSIFGLGALEDIVILGGVVTITLGQIFGAIVILYLFLILSRIVNDIFKANLPRWISADPGVYNTITTLSRYTLIALGIIASLAALGVNVSSLALVAGGLSVGIGLGLQDIIVNFVSGLVLLFEQSLRPGDVVDVDGQVGVVENLSIRATTIRTRDNIEVIIPNGKFTTNQVKTFTGETTEVRVRVPFGVSYGSDPETVRDLANKTAERHNLVKKEPPPEVRFRGYGNSSLDFDLIVWIDQPQLQRVIASDIYFMLFKAFGKNGITIPFPQRDLNLGKGWEKLGLAQNEQEK